MISPALAGFLCFTPVLRVEDRWRVSTPDVLYTLEKVVFVRGYHLANISCLGASFWQHNWRGLEGNLFLQVLIFPTMSVVKWFIVASVHIQTARFLQEIFCAGECRACCLLYSAKHVDLPHLRCTSVSCNVDVQICPGLFATSDIFFLLQPSKNEY